MLFRSLILFERKVWINMALIQITGLTFSYDGSANMIFDGVNLQLDTDWRLGLTGRNGRGKTTLLRLMTGALEYQGSITSKADFAYFPYTVKDHCLTAMEAVCKACPEAEEWEIQRELSLLEVEEEALERPFETLSGGERTKTQLAALFLRKNCFPLIDEPTNHLDLEGRRVLSRYLQHKNGYIVVSHDRAFLDGCVDHILSINRGNIEIQSGNFSSWWENRQRQDQFELEQNAKLKKEIKRLTETAREKADWSENAERRKVGINPRQVDNTKGWRPLQGAKSKKQMARAKAIEKRAEAALEEKSALLKNIELQGELKLAPLAHHADPLLRLEELSAFYGPKAVCKEISFTVRRGERVALQGRNGCGKTTLLKLILGEQIDHTGGLYRAAGLKISYVPQSTAELRGSLADYADAFGLDRSRFLTILRKLGFSREQFETPLERFSEGQKKKALLARSLCQSAHLYIWDEPLNYIDVLSRMQIEELILQAEPTLLFVEHDSRFCETVATKSIPI